MLALSTSWNAWRYDHAQEIVNEIKILGFRQIELSFNLSPAIVKEMLSLKKQGLIQVVSVHNFCPLPKGILRNQASPDIFSLSALDQNERLKAIHYTKISIDTAAKLGAEVLVLHAGRVQIKEKIKMLAALRFNQDRKNYLRLKEQMRLERRLKAKKHLSQALKSLEQLCRYAQNRKVKIGVENRYYFQEIPSIEEMEIVLKTFPAPALYYWHDTGHAQLYENLGLIKHKTILDRFSLRMVGVHLHDIDGIDDHRAPLAGTFDFKLLKPYIHYQTLTVLEPHYPATNNEILRGKKYLEKLLKLKR